jgi:predicted ATPase
MSLQHITIKGYKSINSLDITLKPLNILIGANGSGKSNFISVFKFLNQITESNLNLYVQRSGGADSFLYYGQKYTKKIYINLDFETDNEYESNIYECTLIPTLDNALIFESENTYFHDKKKYPNQAYQIHLGMGHRETLLKKSAEKEKVAKYVLKYLKSWQVYHFHDTSDSAPVKRLGDLNDNLFLRPDAGNLASYLYRLKKTHNLHYQKIRDTIQLVAPFFDDFILRPLPENPNKIQLEWQERGSDYPFLAYQLSDGTLRFICLTTLLLQPELPSTILIDEPELGLHPYAINILASIIKSTSTRTQLIISTQSVPLVNHFSLDDLLVINRKDKATMIERLESSAFKEWLEDYSVGELWEKNVIGGRPSR